MAALRPPLAHPATVAQAANDGDLDDLEAIGTLTLLIAAGGESTTSLLGTAVRLLAERPELQDRLRADRTLVPTFVEEALRYGLAARVVPPELVVEEAVKVGKEIAAKAPLAVRLAKEAVTHAFEGRVDDGIALERKLFYLLFATDDAHEGMRAFAEKRPPSYEGR